jgi:hypothetical protein
MLRLAAMRPLVKAAMDAMPELTTFGFGVHSPQSKTREPIENVTIRRGHELVYGLAELQAIAYWHHHYQIS